ncbi:CsbD family protein [Synechococcales cyanobacterium C]|uniref:CsbD family protein n=1 Tax=Petrachloros mirabilis ULC683 TaxID=2781853 RepID=A0A8K1ZWP4_9CYAN|nr:CsbD family protein [Petrachloros mirabilis]NCJ06273.1 CsbD family protein [Petrachloros mirabilis ULC683]
MKVTRHLVCFGCALLLLGVSQGVMVLDAMAAPSLNTAPLFAKVTSPSEGLDAIAGNGTSDKLEGMTDQATGSVQRAVGKFTGQAEGAVKQAQGKAKEDIGTTKSALEKAGNEAQSTSDSVIDNVKEFFGQ